MKIRCLYLLSFLTLIYLLASFTENRTTNGEDGKFVVVLDAGHGGHDPGNLGNGYLEKNIALNIVLKVGEILSKNPDIKVIYTRKDDTFIDLYVRGEIANKANADLFVSVHCDSHSSDAQGAGTFVLGLHANKQNFEIAKKENSVIYLEDNYETRYAAYDINSPESIIGLTIMQEEFLDQSISLAKMMQDNFSGKLKRADRKVKQAGFIVLHQTFMPSVLVETGFLTNKEEGSYLNSKNGQSEMGEAIADAILKYRNDFISSSTTASPPKGNIAGTVKIEQEIKQDAKEPVLESEKETTAQLELKEKEVNKPKEIKGTVEKKETPLDKVEPGTIAKEEVKLPEQTVPVEKKETILDKNGAEGTKNKENLVFKVQLLASSKDLPLRAEDFKGLNKLSKEPFNNLYRYMYGNTTSYFEAKLLKSNADAKGYTTSFIVAYKDGVRIALQDALKYVSE